MAYDTLRRAAARALLGALILGAGGFIGGCQSRTLFADRDPTAGRLRYFDSDSATATRAQRQQESDMTMGMQNGPSPQ